MNAKQRFTVPATIPLTEAIQAASTSDTLRVKLLSIPHAIQAPKIAIEGQALLKLALSGQLSTKVPTNIDSIPRAIRRSKLSLNTNHASRAVNTASALSKSEAPEAGMRKRPNIKSTGATTPPARIANPNQTASVRTKLTVGARVKGV